MSPHWSKFQLNPTPYIFFSSKSCWSTDLTTTAITFWINDNLTSFAHSQKCCCNEEQNALLCMNSQPAILAPILTPQSQPFWGLQLPERAHLVRGACLGSCPCLHGEPELMVLKWRPDGDRGLIAAEGASVSRPLLLSSYFS